MTTPREDSPAEGTPGRPTIQTAPPRARWRLGAVPGHLGPARTSTFVILVLFIGFFVLYLYVRPPATTATTPGSSSSSVGQTTTSAPPATSTATRTSTTAPRSTTPSTTPPPAAAPTATSTTVPSAPTATSTPPTTAGSTAVSSLPTRGGATGSPVAPTEAPTS